MKLKKCMKRISAILLAATMVVVALPNQPVVKADEDDFPDEILFPVSILDFPADNLFFEYPAGWDYSGYASGMDKLGKNDMKGLVSTELENDPTSIYYRLPVYTEESVDYIAHSVFKLLYKNLGRKNFDEPYIDGKLNPLSMRNYIRRQDWKVLNAEDGELSNGAQISDRDDCLKGKCVGYLGGPTNGSVTLKYNATFAGNHDIRIFYMCASDRDVYITVNGKVNGPYSCNNGSWTTPDQTPMVKSVSGFKVGSNTIVISGPATGSEYTWAPDIDRIEIQNLKGDEPEPVDTNMLQSVEAEAGATYPFTPQYWGGANYGGKTVNDASLGFSGNAYAHLGNWWWDCNTVYRSGNINLKAGLNAGLYDIRVYYTDTGDNPNANFYVNSMSEGEDNNLHIGTKNANPKNGYAVISNVYLNKNNNYIRVRGEQINIDKYEICKAGTGDYSPSLSDYPLGTYAESKAKYNIDENGDKISDYGWYDIETCYDYAYFITANLFKYHPTLSTAYGNYNNLVFHKVEQNGKNYYEFMADQIHKESITKADYIDRINSVYEKMGSAASADEKAADIDRYSSVTSGAGRLIYNPDTRSIRNACDAAGNYVGPTGSEFETSSGFMFVCDGDAYNKDSASHYAGEGIKKYPTLDAPISGDDHKDHNFHYTMRTHSRFVYKEGADQKFFFSGDDDVYVFVNGKLIVDLGGSHEQIDGSFNLDDLAATYGLVNGKAVDFDFFYVERHSTSSNFWGKMSFKLKNDEVELQWPDEFDSLTEMAIPYGWVVDLNYKFSSMRELTTNKNITFSDELGNVIGAKDFKLVDEVKLKPDKKLVVTVHRAQADGSYVDETKEFTFADDHEFTPTEVAAVQEYFKNLALEQDDSVEISGIIYDTAKKQFTDFDATEDAKIRQLHFQTKAEYDAYMTMGGTNSVDDTVAIHSEIKDDVTVKVLIGALKVSTRIEGFGDNFDVKKDLSAFGHFTLKREETEDDDSTPDVDESIVYENEFQIAKGDNNIVFDAEIPDPPAANTIYRDPIPKGTYKLKMDIDMLTGYEVGAEVWVNGEKIADIRRGDVKIIEGREYSFDGIYILIDPKIEGGKWVYPEVEYVLKAYRELNPLKDLT